MRTRLAVFSGCSLLAVLVMASPAFACAGLIGSNGAVNLGRTTTLAAYHDGVEHYVTAFTFLGGGGQFGTLIPLPDVPTSVERGGAWTLQRLVRETQPLRLAAPTAAGRAAGDAAQQRGQQVGDGTPVHLTIPVANPWVPLRILGLGKQPTDRVDADVFLLTDDIPAILPEGRSGLSVTHSAVARSGLLNDLRA